MASKEWTQEQRERAAEQLQSREQPSTLVNPIYGEAAADVEQGMTVIAIYLQCELNEARELLLRVREKDYPQHRIPCPVTMIGSRDCYCGLEEWDNDSTAWISRNK